MEAMMPGAVLGAVLGAVEEAMEGRGTGKAERVAAGQRVSPPWGAICRPTRARIMECSRAAMGVWLPSRRIWRG